MERIILGMLIFAFFMAIAVSVYVADRTKKEGRILLYLYNREIMLGRIDIQAKNTIWDDCYKDKGFFSMVNSGTLPDENSGDYEYQAYSTKDDYYL